MPNYLGCNEKCRSEKDRKIIFISKTDMETAIDYLIDSGDFNKCEGCGYYFDSSITSNNLFDEYGDFMPYCEDCQSKMEAVEGDNNG